MEIRVNFVIHCLIFIPYLLAKPFSLNKAIAEEVRGKQSLQSTFRSKSAETFDVKLIDKSFHLSTITTPSGKDKLEEHTEATNRKTSAQYSKAFKINPPLKPKRLKSGHKLLYKLRNKTGKRAIGNNEIFSHKYIPFLKSLSMLFDNLLHTDKSESYEISKNQYRRNYQYTNDIDEPECSCAFKPYKIVKKLKPRKTATTLTTTFPTEISDDFETIAFTETTSPSTDNTATGHIRSYEWNKNLPILLTRNTFSPRRNDHGIGERNGSANYRSSERYFSGNYRDNECDTRSAKNASFTQYYEKFPVGTTRYYASSVGHPRLSRNKNHSRNSEVRSTTKPSNTSEETSSEKLGRDFNILKEENKFKIGGHETKSSLPLRNLHAGIRQHTTDDETKPSKPATTHKNNEKSHLNVSIHSSSNKRFLDRGGPHTREDQTICRTNETVTSSSPFNTIAPVGNKMALVTIFDGYSVARDVNGENKLAEKALLIHT